MSLSRGEVNPLSVLECRKLSFIPEHFTKISVDKSSFVDVKLLENWINYNLNSRYAIKKNFILDQNTKMVEVIEVGIEDPKELLMLTLGCPYIHNTKKEI
jgi:hypothetical protein